MGGFGFTPHALGCSQSVFASLCVWDTCSGFDINTCRGLKMDERSTSGTAGKSVEEEIVWMLSCTPSKEGEGAQSFWGFGYPPEDFSF